MVAFGHPFQHLSLEFGDPPRDLGERDPAEWLIGIQFEVEVATVERNENNLEQMGQILTREDPDAAEIVQDAFLSEGIEMVFGCKLDWVERRGLEKVIHLVCKDGARRELPVDDLLRDEVLLFLLEIAAKLAPGKASIIESRDALRTVQRKRRQ